ncbi:MAG: hypothetical protein ACTSPI_12745, partial [Candidatus Heimdallarchaeaceae archaeon]
REMEELNYLVNQILITKNQEDFEKTDNKIDSFIYKLFELSKEEIEIVEKFVSSTLELKK